jgi:hypothetical protein
MFGRGGAGRRHPAQQRRHHDCQREAHRDGEVGIGESLDLRLPIGEQPQFLERRCLAMNRIAPGIGVARSHLTQQSHRLRVGRGQVLGDA